MTNAYVSHDAIILAVDPGATSGWALFAAGRYVTSGTAKTHDERAHAVLSAQVEARSRGLPLVVVGEKWTAGGLHANPATMAGLGAAWGAWLAALESEGHPKRRTIRVYPQTWRKIFHARRGTKSEQWKHLAMNRASIEASRPIERHDEADAVCIGIYSTRAREIASVLPKRTARRRRDRLTNASEKERS